MFHGLAESRFFANKQGDAWHRHYRMSLAAVGAVPCVALSKKHWEGVKRTGGLVGAWRRRFHDCH